MLAWREVQREARAPEVSKYEVDAESGGGGNFFPVQQWEEERAG